MSKKTLIAGRTIYTTLVVGIVLSFATRAWAQATPTSPVEKAAADLIQTGVLGSMLVIVMFVAWKLYQRTEAQQALATAAATQAAKDAAAMAEMHRKEVTALQESHRREMMEITTEQTKLQTEANLLTKRQIDLMEQVVKERRGS